MSLYEALVNRFVIPVIEAHKAEGYAEGYPEGYAEGLELARSEWREWHQRCMEAGAQGRPFDEPPPRRLARTASV